MKMLDEYFKLTKDVHNYFGYVEDWVTIPLDDGRRYYWRLNQIESGEGDVWFSTTPEGVDDEDGNETYHNEIYTQCFLPKWVYRGEEYTMIVVDTRTDGNKFLQIFDNKKELV